MGRFFLTVMAGAAEMERNLVRERTAAAMAYKASNGEYVGGKVPYGFDPTSILAGLKRGENRDFRSVSY
jgi:DNA invertase Pin-like site-specific DNA recombinase